MDKIWTWHKVDGKIKFYEQGKLKAHLEHLPGHGEAIFRAEKSKRSRDQRAYYWAVIIPMVKEKCGYITDWETNDEIKMTFNPKPSKNMLGEPIMRGGSIEKESVAEVERIYEEIRAFFAVEFNLIIPLPGEVEV